MSIYNMLGQPKRSGCFCERNREEAQLQSSALDEIIIFPTPPKYKLGVGVGLGGLFAAPCRCLFTYVPVPVPGAACTREVGIR